MMNENKKIIIDDNLTQKDIVQLLLQNAQHMVTREELKADIKELKDDIKQEFKVLKSDLKQDAKELKSDLKQDAKELKTNLKQDISKLEDKVSKIDAKFDKILWLILATTMTILLKDSILSLF